MRRGVTYCVWTTGKMRKSGSTCSSRMARILLASRRSVAFWSRSPLADGEAQCAEPALSAEAVESEHRACRSAIGAGGMCHDTRDLGKDTYFAGRCSWPDQLDSLPFLLPGSRRYHLRRPSICGIQRGYWFRRNGRCRMRRGARQVQSQQLLRQFSSGASQDCASSAYWPSRPDLKDACLSRGKRGVVDGFAGKN